MNGEENNIFSKKKRISGLDAKNITWPALASLTLAACGGGGGGGGQMVQPTPTNRAPVAAADKTVTAWMRMPLNTSPCRLPRPPMPMATV